MIGPDAAWYSLTVHSLFTHCSHPVQSLLTHYSQLEFVMVRHGESEGNIAHKRSRGGDHSLYSGEFLNRHSSLWRLTEKGKQQAWQAGQWIREHITERFDRYLTSEYLRAMETAALMGMPDARWVTETQIRERDWGQWDLASQAARQIIFKSEETRRKRHGMYFAPPAGESMAQGLSRVDAVLRFLHDSCHNQRVLMVCHGELMWAFRIRFERLNQIDFMDMAEEAKGSEKVDNGTILRYSRADPETGEVGNYFKWQQLATPWHKGSSSASWRELSSPHEATYTNKELLEMVTRFPRMYKHSMATADSMLELDYNEGLGPWRHS